MKVLILNSFETKGGAARAANRLHKSLVENGIDSFMRVKSKQTDDWRVIGPRGPMGKLYAGFKSIVETIPGKFQKNNNPILHSCAWVSDLKASEINKSDADIVNLHWVQDGFLSVSGISRIRKPLVWTLHDSWAFCGSEHHPNGLKDTRYIEGYHSGNRPAAAAGIDMDAWTWARKKRLWKRPIQLVTPSAWLADAASSSAIVGKWPVTVIPNPVATDIFKPLDRAAAREIFGLPADKKILLFGAYSYQSDLNKGFDLLKQALDIFADTVPDKDEYLGVIFGQSEPENPDKLSIPVHFAGSLHDDYSLAVLYNAVDVVIVPSRMENLPQTATEAQACGTPVVAFDTCGVPETVDHLKTGYLARPYDVQDLAAGISWVFDDVFRYEHLAKSAREKAVTLWSPEIVARQYTGLYKEVIRGFIHGEL